MIKTYTKAVNKINLVHEQVINYLRKRLINIDCIVESSYFFQETLDNSMYRATIILNSSKCYYVAIHIGDINDIIGTIDFTLLEEVKYA